MKSKTSTNHITPPQLIGVNAAEKPLLAAVLFKARKRFGFTQQNVADALNISRTCYTQIELGKRNITLSEALKIAEAYRVTLDELLKTTYKEPSKDRIEEVVELAWALRKTKSEFRFKAYVREAVKVALSLNGR